MPKTKAKTRKAQQPAMTADVGPLAESAPAKPGAADTRTAERLLALLRYELDPSSGGCLTTELLGKLLEFAGDAVFGGDFPDEPTDADLDRLRAASVIMTEYVLRGLVAAGHAADAEHFVESTAARRRECEAKFEMAREIPFAPGEQRELTAKWDAHSAKSKAGLH